jgi:hypothetical protein
MAVYKVPQDVEADDKLIGPFSFRQFIYLVIVCLSILLAWGLAQLFIPLAMIPLPIIIFFGALALPLRKDQPMEIYMAAMVSFYLKPHKRLWDPDGIDSLIEITVPKTVEVQRSKGISKTEAERRFSYLAEIVDTQGWAVRGPGVQAPNSALNSDVYFEAQQVEDVLDNGTFISQSFDDKLGKSDARRHDEMVSIMAGQPVADATIPGTSNYFGSAPLTEPVAAPEVVADEKALKFNPYPDIQQSVLQPADHTKQVTKPAPTTSEKVVPAGIINLASNTDLSIEAIAREANRIQAKQDSDGGVYISLR